MIRPLLCAFFVILAFAGITRAQSACEVSLNRAQEEFDAGRFAAVPGILNDCVERNQTREWDQRAYLLLAETYLLLQDNAKAEECYLKVLRANPEFIADEKRDPIDLVYLSKKFTSAPIFSFGARFGFNASLPRAIHDVIITPQGDVKKTYSPEVGWQLAMNLDYHYSENLSAGVELQYSFRSFSGRADNLFNEANWAIDFRENQSWISIPVIAKYTILKGNFRPYAFAGFGFNLLLTDKAFIIRNGSDESPELDYMDMGMRNRFARSLIGGAGAKYKWKLKYVFGEIRYDAGLSNLTKAAGRLPDVPMLYPVADDDFRLDNLSLSIGYIHPLYNPRKLKRAKTKSLLRRIGREDNEK